MRDLAVTQGGYRPLRLGADAIAGVGYLGAEKLLQAPDNRGQPLGFHHRAAWPAQVRAEDDPGARLHKVGDGRQRGRYPAVVADLPIPQRDVEIHADQHALAGDVQAAQRPWRHGLSPGWIGGSATRLFLVMQQETGELPKSFHGFM